jgi:7-cyano-7-deazaguanine reductase
VVRAPNRCGKSSGNRVMLARTPITVNEYPCKNHHFGPKVLEFLQMSSAAPLETFPNPRPGREFEIAIDCPEFTSVCPKTGLPDFGEIRITYVPGDRCIELKSLKYYFIEFRNRGIFYEAVTNQILDDLVAACQPRRMTVVGDFTVRGGLKTVVTASYSGQK